jgi:hypothetical protein
MTKPKIAKTATVKKRAVKKPAKKPVKKKTVKKPIKKKLEKIEGLTFKTIQAVTDYLYSLGYDVGKSKVGLDIKGGNPRKTRGVFREADIKSYAKLFNLPKINSDPKAGLTIGGKITAETRLKNITADRQLFLLNVEKGKYFLRSDLVQEQASRVSVLKEALRENFIMSAVEEVIRASGGDIRKAPEVIEIYMIRHGEAFDVYSKPIELEAPRVSLVDEVL